MRPLSKEQLRYVFKDGRLHITSFVTMSKSEVLRGLLAPKRSDYDGALGYLVYLQERTKTKLVCEMNEREATISITLSAPIDPTTLSRRRCLHAAWSEHPLEESLADLGTESNADDELETIPNPYWKSFSDLHFSQVLFEDAVEGPCNVAELPWDMWTTYGFEDRTNRRKAKVDSEEQFLADVDAWGVRLELDMPSIRKIARAAVAHDAPTMRVLLRRYERELLERYEREDALRTQKR